MDNTTTPPSAVLTASGSRTLADLLPAAVERYADRVAIAAKEDGDWIETSYAEVGATVREIALGLLELGLEKGDRVAILANTRPEWSYVDFAVSIAGGVVVPIYPTNSPEECAWVLSNSGSSMVVCEDAHQLAKIGQIRERLPALDQVIVIDPINDTAAAISLDDVRERGRDRDVRRLQKRTASVTAADTYTIIYTSGTTGPPKGCVLSHRNYRALLDSVNELGVIRGDDIVYLFVPLAHTFALSLQLISFDLGATLAYFGGNPAKVIEEVQEIRPTYFPSVPRIFEKIYSMAAPSITAEVGEDRLAEIVALGVKVRQLENAGCKLPPELREEWRSIDQHVFGRVRAVFGGRIREAATGAAPIDKKVLEFFIAAGIPMLEGYGMTETASGIAMSTAAHFKLGSVGRPLPGVEVKIADDGEILVRSANVFEGYYRNEEATAETLIDGWLHTGDLGSIDDDGFLSITGRKKDIIITAGGKNLTPSLLENDLKKSRYVSQAVMHGDRRPFPTMLITLDPDEIGVWAKERGKADDVRTLAKDHDVIELIQSELDKVNANYATVAQVKKFFVADRDLSQDAGELTPTMKVKRGVVNARYRAQFDALYAGS